MILEFLETLLDSKVFLAALLGWLGAQTLKTIIGVVIGTISQLSKNKKTHENTEKHEDIEEMGMVKDMMTSLFWKTGGMPSSHSSMSSALTVAVGFEEGFTSSIFIVAFFFTCIVIRDSMGVRLLTGKLARKVNVLAMDYNRRELNEKKHIKISKIVEGHTVSEVFVGIILGLFMGIALYLF